MVDEPWTQFAVEESKLYWFTAGGRGIASVNWPGIRVTVLVIQVLRRVRAQEDARWPCSVA